MKGKRKKQRSDSTTDVDRKQSLQREVDILRRKLKHEEDARRALERANGRPLGTLPRLPPYLPPSVLQLVAEVAVLEEEVARLEERVVLIQQDMSKESLRITSSKKSFYVLSWIFELLSGKNLNVSPAKFSRGNSCSCQTVALSSSFGNLGVGKYLVDGEIVQKTP